jgi:hypothetical protein
MVGTSETSLVCLVHLVGLMQPNKPDRPNRPHEQDRLADFFSILLEQKSCNHSDEDRGSYPHMLLKHVEGSGSRQGLSKLQGLP